MRTFIHFDAGGRILAVVQTESLPEGVEHPFYLEDESHGALEVTGNKDVGKHAVGDLYKAFKVDVAKRKLVKQSATGGGAKKGAPEAGAAKKGAAKVSAAGKGAAKKGAAKKHKRAAKGRGGR